MSDKPEVRTQPAPEAIDRASFLTEFLAQETTPAVEAPKAEETASEAQATEQPQEAQEGQGQDPAPEPEREEKAEAAPESPEREEAEEAPNPELAKRLEAIQRQEKRAKESIAKERADIENQLKEWAPRIEKAEAFEALLGRARYDLPRVLQELGFTAEDFEPAAKQLYAHSKAAESNPALKEQAARSAREREAFDRLSRLEKQNQDLMQRLEQQQVQVRVNAYMDSVAKAVNDETPLVKNLMANDPADARDQLKQVALSLLEETGEEPDPADVAKELEKFTAARLKKLGVETSKSQTPVAGEQRTAPVKTVSNQLTQTTTPPRKTPKTRKEEETDVLAALESGRIE